MTYYEVITEAIANDETKLKERLQARLSESCVVNDSWFNASLLYGTANGWKMTPEFMSACCLGKEWNHCERVMIMPGSYPVVVLFKPPRGKNNFSSVRVKDERGAVVWELDQAKTVFTKDVYAGLVPPECGVEFVDVDAKCLGPEIFGARKSEGLGGPSTANKRSGDSGETTTRQPSAVDEEMGETTPRQPGAVDEQWGEGDKTPRQLAEHASSSGTAGQHADFPPR